jgi:hypothetical protein
MEPATLPRCKSLNAAGEPCASPFVDPETGFCQAHEAGGLERLRERSAKGGKVIKGRKSRRMVVDPSECPEPPETLEDAARWLSWLPWAVATGKIDARTAHEAAYALRGFLDSRKAIDRTDERVKALKAQLAKLKASMENGRND